MAKKLKHDSLVKIIMNDPVAAQEFLEYYLPDDFKSLVDLSLLHDNFSFYHLWILEYQGQQLYPTY